MKNKRQGFQYQNNRGQIAIFVALVFQILFVFFAMVINVGLLVHDKINLQNSVDLAAYYMAQKQADILNTMAHTNYQMRQAWKLLSWRVRAIGDAGKLNHPLNPRTYNAPLEERPIHPTTMYPIVCTRWSFWQETGRNENLCKTGTMAIPSPPSTPVIARFNPINILLEQITGRARDIFNRSCEDAGPVSWLAAARWMTAYRIDIRNKKQTMYDLANNLGQDNFLELNGLPVRTGVEKVLKHNLTRANLESLTDDKWGTFNSLSRMPPSSSGDRPVWISDLPVVPLIFYGDFESTGGGCFGRPKILTQDPTYLGRNGGLTPDLISTLKAYIPEPSDLNDPLHSSVGFEKNPWFMVYAGVWAETKPRKPFAPFGRPITLRAEAFAKPFGGRFGPWRYNQWPNGAGRSDGPVSIDPLLPPVATGGGNDVPSFSPNYSRFPGDTLGLNSFAAIGQFRTRLRSSPQQISLRHWGYLPNDTAVSGDSLAWSTNQQENQLGNFPGPWVREFEVAAVSPDIFDVTYYSIEPNFEENYRMRARPFFQSRPTDLRPDFGARFDQFFTQPFVVGDIPAGSSFSEMRYNLRNQIQIATGGTPGTRPVTDPNFNFYYVKNYGQLLTSWLPTSSYQFDELPEDRFGKCTKVGENPIPGHCLKGGRTGYSVKIVSRNYLNGPNHPIGGEGITGPILNPPPAFPFSDRPRPQGQ